MTAYFQNLANPIPTADEKMLTAPPLTSGRKTMKESGSSESPSSRSKCVIVASSNSSENGGFASNEPHCGLKSKKGLENAEIKI